MAISADDRDELRRLAQTTWGDRGADLLMAGLAQVDLREMEERLSLRIDLVRSELRGEMGELRSDLQGQMGELRGEFHQLRGEFDQLREEFRGELSAFRGEVRGEIGELRGDFGKLQGYVGMELGAIRSEIGAQNRLFLFSIIACFAAVAATVFGALQLVG